MSVCPKPLLRRCPVPGPEQGLAPNLSPPDATLAIGKKELGVDETKHLALAIANLKEDKLF